MCAGLFFPSEDISNYLHVQMPSADQRERGFIIMIQLMILQNTKTPFPRSLLFLFSLLYVFVCHLDLDLYRIFCTFVFYPRHADAGCR